MYFHLSCTCSLHACTQLHNYYHSFSGRKTLAALLSKSPIPPRRGHSIPTTSSTLTTSTTSEGKVEGVEPVSVPESPLLLAHVCVYMYVYDLI